jgi:hypothetical protein
METKTNALEVAAIVICILIIVAYIIHTHG